jgi:hypothetical protein
VPAVGNSGRLSEDGVAASTLKADKILSEAMSPAVVARPVFSRLRRVIRVIIFLKLKREVEKLNSNCF